MLKIVILPPTCAAPTEIASPTKALEAAKFRLALSIDLAAIISLALVFLAQDLVGRIEFGKALSGFRVILVGVRVKLLGELTKCALNRGRIRILLHPQHFIGVAHRKYLRLGAGIQPRLFGSNVVVMRQLRNAKRLAPRATRPRQGSTVRFQWWRSLAIDWSRRSQPSRAAARTKQLARHPLHHSRRYRRHGLRLRTSQRPTSLRQASPCIHASALSWT